jgi:hypothetical protein
MLVNVALHDVVDGGIDEVDARSDAILKSESGGNTNCAVPLVNKRANYQR